MSPRSSIRPSIFQHDVWKPEHESRHEASESDIQLHYKRAKLLCRTSGLTIDDVLHLTPKFWDFHFDMVSARDMTAFIISTIHLNLCIGTIAGFAASRPDLATTLDDLLNFRTCGEFMLTETGHGLDARNLETTATLEDNGFFILNTPTFAAAKAMPPATPLAGISRIAVVFARLFVKGEDRGVKPFLTPINSTEGMCPGIVTRFLPIRPGTKPLDHSVTTFNNVRLHPSALLGSTSKAKNEREDFLTQIWRVSVGTLSLSIMGVSAIKIAGCIAAAYSQRRQIGTGRDGQTMPIIRFSTQNRPILKALAYGEVLHAYALWTVQEFMNPKHNPDVRRGLAAAFKTLVVQSSHLITELAERCGWQGLFAYNQIIELASTFQGNSIAEGDTLVICIRLASELLMGKYSLPEPNDGNSPLAKHEIGLFQEAAAKLSSMPGGHRGDSFNNNILPRCRRMIEATGQRLAYEAALRSPCVAPEVLDLFVRSCIREDASWYIEHGLGNHNQIWDDEDEAFTKLNPMLPELVARTDARDYITAPIVTEEKLEQFIGGLTTFGNEKDDILGQLKHKSRL
ncbi:uncharacterized protein CTRU02_215483 [Colletotrichum truncatum]|uniref:Uncharacterized protein n=1 Tax=Colletotrichum truncatum TaxID=5467 RepID=A0ACC3YCL5_COLTU|nr:uncharacterized protein CTRU02_05572 [Colletotrichum truncatum]KAF6794015.1 hypothetical protein CTRU02_05572 [Colletotrichum truncatum]